MKARNALRFERIIIALAAASGAVASAGQSACAQGTGAIPVRAKIGAFLPGGDAKDFAGSTHLSGEVDVAIPALGAGRTFVTAGYYSGSEDGRRLRMIPVTVGRLFSPPNPAGRVTGNVYFGLGVGAYFLRTSGGGRSDSKTAPGGFGMVGYQFPNPFFIEAKYHVAGSIRGISPNGLAILVGRRF